MSTTDLSAIYQDEALAKRHQDIQRSLEETNQECYRLTNASLMLVDPSSPQEAIRDNADSRKDDPSHLYNLHRKYIGGMLESRIANCITGAEVVMGDSTNNPYGQLKLDINLDPLTDLCNKWSVVKHGSESNMKTRKERRDEFIDDLTDRLEKRIVTSIITSAAYKTQFITTYRFLANHVVEGVREMVKEADFDNNATKLQSDWEKKIKEENIPLEDLETMYTTRPDDDHPFLRKLPSESFDFKTKGYTKIREAQLGIRITPENVSSMPSDLRARTKLVEEEAKNNPHSRPNMDYQAANRAKWSEATRKRIEAEIARVNQTCNEDITGALSSIIPRHAHLPQEAWEKEVDIMEALYLPRSSSSMTKTTSESLGRDTAFSLRPAPIFSFYESKKSCESLEPDNASKNTTSLIPTVDDVYSRLVSIRASSENATAN